MFPIGYSRTGTWANVASCFYVSYLIALTIIATNQNLTDILYYTGIVIKVDLKFNLVTILLPLHRTLESLPITSV